MFVKAILVVRKGIENFDPLRDYLFRVQQNNTGYFYTWCKSDRTVPGSSRVAGVFMGDDYDNNLFVGARELGGLWYINAVLPYLERGYQHSAVHRLFAPPKDLAEMMFKLSRINALYFGHLPEPKLGSSADSFFKWTLSDQGIEELDYPDGPDQEYLQDAFRDIWHQLLFRKGMHFLNQPLYKKFQAEQVA